MAKGCAHTAYLDQVAIEHGLNQLQLQRLPIGRGREYSRDDGTPTWEALEKVVGGLESGQAVAFASGMAAIASVFDQLPAGSVVALPDDCYQGVAGLAAAGAQRGRWSVQRVALDDTTGCIRACGQSDLVWLESPSNPLLSVADLEAICAAPRKPGAIVAVDNRFARPLNQRPLHFGATVSLQSATKFIGGHSDLLGGVATTKMRRSGMRSRSLVSSPAPRRVLLPRLISAARVEYAEFEWTSVGASVRAPTAISLWFPRPRSVDWRLPLRCSSRPQDHRLLIGVRRMLPSQRCRTAMANGRQRESRPAPQSCPSN